MGKDKELKKEIILWLLEHEYKFQRVNTCIDEFRNYIYNDNGNYLIGGENVRDFIINSDKLLYGGVKNGS